MWVQIRLLLTKIVINDFGVYRGRNEFNFETVPDKPIILCGGGNGAGKTTMFESVMLCLYGQNSFEKKTTQKQYQEKILRTIHRYLGTKKSADEASIIIEFQFAHEGKIVEYQIKQFIWRFIKIFDGAGLFRHNINYTKDFNKKKKHKIKLKINIDVLIFLKVFKVIKVLYRNFSFKLSSYKIIKKFEKNHHKFKQLFN